jgi:hypothetical protein
MGVIFIDGFNHYSGPQLAAKWGDASASVFVDSGANPVRTGPGAFRTGSTGAFIRRIMDTPHNFFIVGFALRNGATVPAYQNTGFEDIMSFRDVNHVSQLTIRYRPSKKVMKVVGGPVATPAWESAETGKISLGQGFFYFEIKRNVGGVPSWELKMDGQVILSGTQDVASQGAGDSTWIYLGGGLTDTTFDDVYILDNQASYPGAGSKNQNYLGPCSVKTIWMIGQGPDSQWVGSDGDSVNNWQHIDDNPDAAVAPDGDTTYVQSGTFGNRDSYEPSTSLPSGQAVFALQVANYARRAGLDALNMNHIVRESAGAWESLSEFLHTVPDAQYMTPCSVWDQDPNNLSPQDWTKAIVESRRFGNKVA